MREWELRVDDLPDPVPASGQALVRVLACGICGSDLHMLRHGAEQLRLTAEFAEDQPPDPLRIQTFDPAHDTVMGHEYCCEVVEVGPDCTNLRAGDVVVSMPVAFDAGGLHAVGYSNRYPGGYGELMLLNDLMALKVPTGLDPTLAALTEPLAVGEHAVAKSRIQPGEAAVVLGCGPVGLAVVAALRRRGLGPVVAADHSPMRRQLAERLGADVVVDPAVEPAIAAWRRIDGTRPLVIFEAVGVPGMISQAMRMAPRHGRILVVGVCMQADSIHPMLGIGKELQLQFALGYEPAEFADSLTAIADGTIDVSPWITGTVGIDEVPGAFSELAAPDRHAKILVVPRPTGR